MNSFTERHSCLEWFSNGLNGGWYARWSWFVGWGFSSVQSSVSFGQEFFRIGEVLFEGFVPIEAVPAVVDILNW